jgi:hypothetical protein
VLRLSGLGAITLCRMGGSSPVIRPARGAVEYRSGTGRGCGPGNRIQRRVSGWDRGVHGINLAFGRFPAGQPGAGARPSPPPSSCWRSRPELI